MYEYCCSFIIVSFRRQGEMSIPFTWEPKRKPNTESYVALALLELPRFHTSYSTYSTVQQYITHYSTTVTVSDR